MKVCALWRRSSFCKDQSVHSKSFYCDRIGDLIKIPVIAIVGPTATGKSELAISLAEKLKTEIVSADAFQIYKEFSICTAKPSLESLSKVRHHFVDHISVTEDYSVAKFVREAKKVIAKFFSNGKIPILVGGTGLYVDALLDDYKFEKEEFLKSSNLERSENTFRLIQEISLENISFLNQDDKKYIKYILEFFDTFEIAQQKKVVLCSNDFYNIIRIGLNCKNRVNLYTKVNARVDRMMADGLVEEIKYIKQNFNVSKTASVAIGYKELLQFLENKVTLEQAIETIKMQTRRYAKRQITWFKRKLKDNWFFIDLEN